MNVGGTETTEERRARETPKGKPSPRWALWNRYLIPCQNGLMYLARLRIVQTPWFGVYIHDIFEPDADRDPHNHPWAFISVVLRGHYVERVYLTPDNAQLDADYLAGDPSAVHRDHRRYVEKRHRRFSAHRMGRTSAHRIVEAAPRLKTLILCGPRRSGWGFYRDGEYVPWQDYIEQRVHAPEKGVIGPVGPGAEYPTINGST